MNLHCWCWQSWPWTVQMWACPLVCECWSSPCPRLLCTFSVRTTSTHVIGTLLWHQHLNERVLLLYSIYWQLRLHKAVTHIAEVVGVLLGQDDGRKVDDAGKLHGAGRLAVQPLVEDGLGMSSFEDIHRVLRGPAASFQPLQVRFVHSLGNKGPPVNLTPASWWGIKREHGLCNEQTRCLPNYKFIHFVNFLLSEAASYNGPRVESKSWECH